MQSLLFQTIRLININKINLTMIILDRNIPREVRKRLLLRRTRIFTRWLKITFEKPYTVFLAGFFPFMQAFLASIIVIYTKGGNDIFTNAMLFLVAGLLDAVPMIGVGIALFFTFSSPFVGQLQAILEKLPIS